MDTAPIKAYSILHTKNNMHSIVGDVRIRLALVDDIGTVLTNKEIVCRLSRSGEVD